MFVTFTVGGLSAINAIAGAFSDDLPVIIVSGGLNRYACPLPAIACAHTCVVVLECAQGATVVRARSRDPAWAHACWSDQQVHSLLALGVASKVTDSWLSVAMRCSSGGFFSTRTFGAHAHVKSIPLPFVATT